MHKTTCVISLHFSPKNKTKHGRNFLNFHAQYAFLQFGKQSLNLKHRYNNLRTKQAVFTKHIKWILYLTVYSVTFYNENKPALMFTCRIQKYNTCYISYKQHNRSNHPIHYNTNIVINHNIQCSINPQFCEREKKKGIKLSVSLLKMEKRFLDYHYSELVRHIHGNHSYYKQ